MKLKGEVVEIIASCVDITQLKQYEELVLKSEKLNIAGRLAAGIAHEIRNPLTALKGFVKLLRESGANPKYLDIMDAELDRIKVIVDQFVNLAKPQKVNFSSLEIKEIICHVLTLINTEAIMDNIEIGYEMEDHLPPIVGDENQLKQMFLNLLKNAIEAMPDGGKLMVKVNREHHQKGERQEEMILIQITDQGKGMSKEVIDRLGQPFFTTKEEGTGLGLLTSRKIIEDHRGLLSIKSKEGEGTTMEVRLPVEQKGVLSAYTK